MNYIVNPKNYSQVSAIATENNLETVETTSERNGYPRNIRNVVTGFESYQAAKDFANKYNGEVVEITRRDGWQLWYENGKLWEPYTRYDIENDDNLTETSYTWDGKQFKVAVSFSDIRIVELQDLADYINSCDEMPEDLDEIADYNEWEVKFDGCYDNLDGKVIVEDWEGDQVVFNAAHEAIAKIYE